MQRVEFSKPVLEQYKNRTKQKDFIGGNPVTLESKHVYNLWRKNFNVTPKVDGTRYLCIFDSVRLNPKSTGPKKPFFIDRGGSGTHLRVFQPKHTTGNLPSPRNFPACILDGEMVSETKKGRTRFIYWIFDILSFEGQMITGLSFDQRFSILQTLNKYCKAENQDSNWLSFEIKPYYSRQFYSNSKDPYEDIKKEFTGYCKQLGFSKPVLDGLILNDTSTPYVKGPWSRCDNIQHKWKPQEEQTIDMVLGKNNKVLGRDGKEYTYKYTDKKTQKEYTLRLDKPADLPSDKPKQENKELVVELRLTGLDLKRQVIKNSWVRYRTDKQANAYKTINSVVNAWIYPVKNLKSVFARDPRKITKYLTRYQILRVLHRSDLFSQSNKASLKKLCKKDSAASKKPIRKFVIRLPNKSVPIECFEERDFPKAVLHESHSPSKGEVILLENKLEVPKFDGQPKMWTADGKNIIKLKTDYIYNTPVVIIPMTLKPAGAAAVANKGKILKTIFRITAYTNIIFENPQRGEKTYYVESYPGENPEQLFKLIKLLLEL